jgi:hypothetical protein
MPTSWWIAAGGGAGIVAVHVGIRLVAHRWARTATTRTALQIEVASVVGRMLVVLVLTVLVLLFVPVPVEPFVAALVGFLLLSIAVEGVLVARRLSDGSSHV